MRTQTQVLFGLAAFTPPRVCCLCVHLASNCVGVHSSNSNLMFRACELACVPLALQAITRALNPPSLSLDTKIRCQTAPHRNQCKAQSQSGQPEAHQGDARRLQLQQQQPLVLCRRSAGDWQPTCSLLTIKWAIPRPPQAGDEPGGPGQGTECLRHAPVSPWMWPRSRPQVEPTREPCTSCPCNEPRHWPLAVCLGNCEIPHARQLCHSAFTRTCLPIA